MLPSANLPPTVWGDHRLTWGERTYVMGILNITPDSFSRDGLALAELSSAQVVSAAVEQARAMVAAGADMLDVGGESTRPATEGEEPLPADVERARVVPVIEALAAALPSHILISIDTFKAAVAEAALDAGAHIVNDIWGLRADSALARVVAEREVPVVLMSNLRGQPRRDPLSDIVRQLSGSVDVALSAGIEWARIILDPGFGFGLHAEENLEALARLGALRSLSRPLLVGVSRKSHIGLVLDAPVDDRVEGTAAEVALSIAQGADIVRVHDVWQMARVARVSDAVVRGWRGYKQAEERRP
ncbi:MAG TPA: dihydropteroate synthase [Ktedonobacterales bacterium]|nr:dihydropteroate synthase [Ktedonobacterales bacterium]